MRFISYHPNLQKINSFSTNDVQFYYYVFNSQLAATCFVLTAIIRQLTPYC